ncbi:MULTISPECIES: WXG100 family type VII secretion target [unclassified Microbacterium]|uniref:WXG100 family type VII secretion target n=1 Tax=Microbacterium TaxID=33882 RepID=UPI003BA24B45
MPIFAVDSDALVAQSANVRATGDRIQADSDTMLAQLLELQAVWQGSAAAGFQSVMDQWRAAQLAIQESLASIGQALNVAGMQYAEAEQASAGMFR